MRRPPCGCASRRRDRIPGSPEPLAESGAAGLPSRPFGVPRGRGLLPRLLLVRVPPRCAARPQPGPGPVAADRPCPRPARPGRPDGCAGLGWGVRAHAATPPWAVLDRHQSHVTTRGGHPLRAAPSRAVVGPGSRGGGARDRPGPGLGRRALLAHLGRRPARRLVPSPDRPGPRRPAKCVLLEEPRPIWSGSGLAYPEAPHLYRVGDWWYLLIAEGGTERGHAVSVARARRPDGPFQGCPENPVLSHRSIQRAIQSTGHADLVRAPDGS